MTIIHTIDICASRYHSGFLDGIHICFLLGLGGCIVYLLTQINKKDTQDPPIVINVYMNDKNEDEDEEEEEEEEEEVEENEVDDVDDVEEELPVQEQVQEPVQEPIQEPIQEQLQNPGVEEQNQAPENPAPLSN